LLVSCFIEKIRWINYFFVRLQHTNDTGDRVKDKYDLIIIDYFPN